MWDLSYPVTDGTCVPCIARQILNHGAVPCSSLLPVLNFLFKASTELGVESAVLWSLRVAWLLIFLCLSPAIVFSPEFPWGQLTLTPPPCSANTDHLDEEHREGANSRSLPWSTHLATSPASTFSLDPELKNTICTLLELFCEKTRPHWRLPNSNLHQGAAYASFKVKLLTVVVQSISGIQLFATLWIAEHQAPLSLVCYLA